MHAPIRPGRQGERVQRDKLDMRPHSGRFSPPGMLVPPLEGRGRRMALRGLGIAGCPALPAVRRNAASCVPAHRYPAASDKGVHFSPLPLASPPACRLRMFSRNPWSDSLP